MNNENQINNQDSRKNTQQEKNLMNRRGFLKAFGLLAGGAVELMACSPITQIKPPESKLDRNQENEENNLDQKYEKTKQEIEKEFDACVENGTYITNETIQEEIEKCNFVDTENLKIQEIPVSISWHPGMKERRLTELVKMQYEHAKIPLETEHLSIAKMDFNKINPSNFAAFYIREHRKVYISEEPQENRREYLSKSMYTKIIRDEAENLIEEVEKLSNTEVEKEAQKDLIREWANRANDGDKDIAQLPKELLIKHSETIKELLDKTQRKDAIEKVLGESILGHEIFHDFMHNQFEKEGYSGPTAEDVLKLANSTNPCIIKS